MKRSLIMLAMAAIALTGCAQNKATEQSTQPPEETMPEETSSMHYENSELGIAFDMLYGDASTVVEENGKLAISGSPQDYLEIYTKEENETLEEAVKRLVTAEGADLEQCEIVAGEAEGQDVLRVQYMKEFLYEPNGCTEEGPVCYYEQAIAHDKNAANICSSFEQSGYKNFFLYQPENTKTKFAYIRHVTGMDAPPWDVQTIRLFDGTPKNE